MATTRDEHGETTEVCLLTFLGLISLVGSYRLSRHLIDRYDPDHSLINWLPDFARGEHVELVLFTLVGFLPCLLILSAALFVLASPLLLIARLTDRHRTARCRRDRNGSQPADNESGP